MPVLYLTTPGSTLLRHRGALLIEAGEDRRSLGPLVQIDRACVFGAVSITPSALNLLLGAGCTIAFFTQTGRLKGMLARPGTGDTRVRLAQGGAAGMQDLRVRLAAGVVHRKLRALHALLAERHRRAPDEALRRGCGRLAARLRRIGAGASLAELRGLEGAATAAYYQALAGCFTGAVGFAGTRSRRPPRDPANALLSFLYTLLTAEAADVLAAYGLDPALGFLHGYRAGRASLACDLVEPFRSLAADRLALRLFNRNELRPEHFSTAEQTGVRLTPDGLRLVLAAYETLMQEPAPAYVAAALGPDDGADDDAAGPSLPGTLPGLRGMLHLHARRLRGTLLARVNVDDLMPTDLPGAA